MNRKSSLFILIVIFAIALSSLLVVLVQSTSVLKGHLRRQKEDLTSHVKSVGVRPTSSHRGNLLNIFVVVLTIAFNIGVMLRISNVGASTISRVENSHTSPQSPCAIPTYNGQPTPTNLEYFCGPVLQGSIQEYVLFWEPSPPSCPSCVVDSHYNDLLIRYYKDVGNSGLFNLLSQYSDNNGNKPTGATYQGDWVDPKAFHTHITSSDITNEIDTAITSHGFCHGSYSCYIAVMFAPFATGGYNDCDTCHSYYVHATDTLPTAFGVIDYPIGGSNTVPYNANNCLESLIVKNTDCDSAISAAAHEEFEAITDPLGIYTIPSTPTIPSPSPSGYHALYRGDGLGSSEIGDLCGNTNTTPAIIYGSPTTEPGSSLQANQKFLNATSTPDWYTIQWMWDNNANGLGKLGECSPGTPSP